LPERFDRREAPLRLREIAMSIGATVARDIAISTPSWAKATAYNLRKEPTMIRGLACLVLCAAGVGYGQSDAVPRFEVASIKPSNADSSSSSGIKTGHGRLTAENVTLKRCIIGAYVVGPHQIFGGPDWLDLDRFEITAIADQPVGDSALMAMLQNLLAERFKLALHRETRVVQAYTLEIGKGAPKLEKAAAGEGITNSSTSNGRAMIDAHNTSMDSFAQLLARQMDLPVVNHTELKGVFNFRLQWTRENALSAKPEDAAANEAPSIFTAIQEQLGLRLRARKAPVEILVIDHAEKPTEN
jgi:uncharacterized protein (TIGR03435 family)